MAWPVKSAARGFLRQFGRPDIKQQSAARGFLRQFGRLDAKKTRRRPQQAN